MTETPVLKLATISEQGLIKYKRAVFPQLFILINSLSKLYFCSAMTSKLKSTNTSLCKRI